jgi:cell division protein FtsL
MPVIAIDPIKQYSLPASDDVLQRDPAAYRRKREAARRAAARQTRERVAILFTILACGAVAVFLVSRYAALVADNYQLQAMESQLSHEQSQTAALQAQVFELSSPTRILNIAEHVLHMQPATAVTVSGNAG